MSCRDEDESRAWFAALFGRTHDAAPMGGLAEWHLGSDAGFQLTLNPPNAGHGTLTVFVDDLNAERARLSETVVSITEVEAGDAVDFMQLRDPDGNLVVLVRKRSGD